MEILEIARRRKTVRKFSKKSISMDDIIYCIEVAKEAPSGMNSQPWRFLILTEKEKKRRVREICEGEERKFHEKVKGPLSTWLKERKISWEKKFLEEAPALVLVFSIKKFPYFNQSTWLSIGYFLLALEEKGLATVTYTPPNERAIKEFLGVPAHYKLESILPIGYSADEKKKEERMRVDEITFMNGWGK